MRSYPTLRRGLVAAACATALTAASAAPASAAGFKFGVAAADVKPTSALLWTRSDSTGKLKLEIAPGANFQNKRTIDNLSATAATDNTVGVVVGKLKGGKDYYYRFRKGDNKSVTGHFRTPPLSTADKRVRFAISGDADAERAKGQKNIFYNNLKGNNGLGAENFGVYRRMALENNDFNINLGDTIYSDSEVAGHPLAATVPAKRAKYKLNLAVPALQLLRAATGIYNNWDDHEFRNDFSKPEHGAAIYNAGVKAFREYMPVRYTPSAGTYIKQPWGKNLEVFRLDERSFRSGKASANHTCDNPQTGEPDLAPTAPQSTRDLFSVLIPSFSSPVSQACKNKINDPKRTFLGIAQRDKFINQVKASKAKFKVIINELPIQQFYALPYDRWEGYEAERKRVLHALQNAGVKNVVWLATDVHANMVNVVRYKTLEEGGPQNSPYREFVTGPVSTMTFEREINQATGSENGGAVDAFFGAPPPNGPGMSCSNLNVYSYAEVTVTGKLLKVTAKDVAGNVVKDQSEGTPCVLNVPAS
ncbi:MAG TPA: alkaline phosphatase D family protein [Thermoleophilaceae bacterium]|nr:alkaline phosphatase D family protein [Thermoleophilaceae bacterium]